MLSILHPVDREGISKARADVFAFDYGFTSAVSSPRVLASVGGSHGVNSCVTSEFGEHGATLAGFDVERHLLEELLFGHPGDCLL